MQHRREMYRGENCQAEQVRANVNSSRVLEDHKCCTCIYASGLWVCHCQLSCTVGMKTARVHMHGAAEFGTTSLSQSLPSCTQWEGLRNHCRDGKRHKAENAFWGGWKVNWADRHELFWLIKTVEKETSSATASRTYARTRKGDVGRNRQQNKNDETQEKLA